MSTATAAPKTFQAVADLVEMHATRNPNAIAIESGRTQVSYAEVSRRATRVACALAANGLGRGDVVAVSLARSADLPATLLGVMKAGAAYLPLAADLPRERWRFILRDAAVRATIAGGEFERDATSDCGKLLLLNEIETLADRVDEDWCAPVIGPKDLSYVIYTSGSTGRPKGVAVTHGGLANVTGSMAETLRITREDIWLAATTISFDIAALELFLPLTSGARVGLANTEEARDGSALRALAGRWGATVLQGTPALWRMLLLSGPLPDSLRLLLCGGEAMPPDLANRLAAHRKAEVWNLYGPTETTIWSTAHRLGRASYERSPPIGKPIANTTVHVLDAQLQPVESGAPGGLFIGGAGVAAGYVGRPDLTEAAFLPDPFAKDTEARLYRTGDLVRSNGAGELEYLGREDNQVKIRGYRIELAEVEAALYGIAGIRGAAAAAIDDASGEKQLVAYLVLDSQSGIGPATVRNRLEQVLPAYMIPSRFVPLSELPLNASGKLDRVALAAAEEPSMVRETGSYNRTGTVLSEIWSEVFRLPVVGPEDDFFDLGGHSLLATLIALRTSEAFGVELTLQELMDHSTISALAALIDSGVLPKRQELNAMEF